jgi:hypothetical protein
MGNGRWEMGDGRWESSAGYRGDDPASTFGKMNGNTASVV